MRTPFKHSRKAFSTLNPKSWALALFSILLLVGFAGRGESITLSANSWTPIGPAPFGNPFAGRVDVAASDPSNTSIMYLGANVGGIWKTTNWLNGSPKWNQITDKPQILSQAVHEHDLVVFNSNIILAAASGPNGGIMRSDDGGNSWTYLGNSSFRLAEFGALVADPNVANAQTLYVATSGGFANFLLGSGLYKSTDGGANWTDAGLGTFSGYVSDLLEIQENGQTVLYAADREHGQAHGGAVYRSPDGGVTWTQTNFPTNAAGYNSIRLAGSTMPTERIYASAIDTSNGDGGLSYRFVTSDHGGSWSPLSTVDAPAPSARHRFHHDVLAVDPANSRHVVVNTDIEDNLVTRPSGEWIFDSTDSGQTWTAAVDAGGDPVSGTFDSTGVFVVTSDGGVHRDPVNTPSNLANKGGNLNTIEFYSFSIDPSNLRGGYGLFQDGPGILAYFGILNWAYFQPPTTGEAGKVRVDPTNLSRVYFLDPNTKQPVSSPNDSSRFVHSAPGGTWEPAITGLPEILVVIDGVDTIITDYASFPGKGSIVLDPGNPQRLLLGLATFKDKNNVTTPGSVFETTTGGDPNNSDPKFSGNGWRNIGSNLAGFQVTISALAIAPSAPNTIFAGTEEGRIFKTTNAGNDCNPDCPTWTEVDAGLPGDRIMDLEIDPANPDHDFAVTSPFLFRDDAAPDYSSNFHVWVRDGGGWSQINGTAPNDIPRELGGETMAVDWQTPTPVLYLGTLRGAYKSEDLGATWSRMNSMPRTRVTDFDFMPNLHLLAAGTIGWGAWEILTQSTPPAITPPAQQTSVEAASHFFSLGSFSDPDGGPWSVNVDWGDGSADPIFSVSNAGPLSDRSHQYSEEGPYTVTITVTDTLVGQSDSKTFAVNVTEAPVAASGGFTVETNVGTPTGAQPMATFTDPAGAEPNASDPNPPTSAGHYAANIAWGDGSQFPGAITPLTPTSPSQVFTVTGDHTYAIESPVGGFNVVTTINHEGMNSSANSTAIVGRAGRVTGSGEIGSGRGFSFVAQPDRSNGFKGDLSYTDGGNTIKVTGTSITFVSILSDNQHATFKGTATVNGVSGYTFRVDLEDNGEPAKGLDRFRIRFDGPTSYDSNTFAANGGLLSAGDVQVHK